MSKVLNALDVLNGRVAGALTGTRYDTGSMWDSKVTLQTQSYTLSSVYSNVDIQKRAMSYIYDMDCKKGEA